MGNISSIIPDFSESAKKSLVPSPAAAEISSLPPAHPKRVFFQHAMYSFLILALAIALTSVSFFSDKTAVDIQGRFVTEISSCQNQTQALSSQVEAAEKQLAILSQQLTDTEQAKSALEAQQAGCVTPADIAGLQQQVTDKQTMINDLQKQLDEQQQAEGRSCDIEIRDAQRDANSLMQQLYTATKEKCAEAVIEGNLTTVDAITAAVDAKVTLADYQFKDVS